MKTKTRTTNNFCYNMRRWPVAKESKRILKKLVLDAIDLARSSLEDNVGIDGTYLYNNSVLNEFSDKQKIVLLNRLEDAINGKPFIGVSSSSDLILEELLNSVLSSHVIMSLDFDGEDTYNTNYCNRIRKIYHLNGGEETDDRDDIFHWFENGELWWDQDWKIFQVDTKAYSKEYLK
jgi:hypothetical protein